MLESLAVRLTAARSKARSIDAATNRGSNSSNSRACTSSTIRIPVTFPQRVIRVMAVTSTARFTSGYHGSIAHDGVEHHAHELRFGALRLMRASRITLAVSRSCGSCPVARRQSVLHSLRLDPIGLVENPHSQPPLHPALTSPTKANRHYTTTNRRAHLSHNKRKALDILRERT